MTASADARHPRGMPAEATPPADWPLFRRIAGEHAEERVTRVLAFAFLPGAVLFGLLGAPSAIAQSALWPGWWTVVAFGIGILPSMAMGVWAFSAPLPVLRLLARVNVVGTVLVLATIPLVIAPGHTLQAPIWFADLCGLGLISAALALPPLGAVAVSAVGGALNLLDRLALGESQLVVAVQTGLYVTLFTLTFIALGVSSLSAAKEADVAEAAAEAATAEAAADAARERERSRINELVHDRVLATLLTAARQIPGSGGLEQRDARRALEGLQALLRDDAVPEDLTGEELVWKVQAITTELLPAALFSYALDDEEAAVPGPAVGALLDAAEEAMRNSLRHAGTANRTVHVQVDDGCVDVDVLDDGVGFDRVAVPPGRLGLSDSIEARMRALPGGSAHVISRPGVGTRVSLRWRAP